MITAADRLALAYDHHVSGRFAEAEIAYLEILDTEPRNGDALELFALLAAQTGRPERAVVLFREAVGLQPELPELHYNLARALQATGQLGAAAGAYRRAVTLNPGFAEAYVNLADVLLQLGEHDEALECGVRAITLGPDLAEAYNNFGNAQRERGELAAAVEAYSQALTLNPHFAVAHNNIGTVLQQKGQQRDAIQCYRRALALLPDYVDAHYNLGNALSDAGHLEQAAASYCRAIEIDPDFAPAVAQLAHIRVNMCDWGEAEVDAAQVLALVRCGSVDVPPFNLLEQRSTPADQLLCARHWSRRLAAGVQVLGSHRPPMSDRQICVGYLSADFRDHPVGYAMIETIECHDRQRFSICGYSIGPDDRSALRSRFESAFDRFIDLRADEDADAARRIYEDGVDILVDLTGYTSHARPRILALRPAPVQVNYLGFLGTMGADFIDYVIVDPTVVPTAQQSFYTEKLVHLADCWWPAAIRWEISNQALPRDHYGLAEDAFVFCCFNTSYKITPATFDIWARLLQSVPRGVLWLSAASDLIRANLRSAAAQRRVDPDRLIFAPHESMADYLARHRHADLFLDTLPYNAVGTAYHALWAGLPLITCIGETFAGRTAATMLHAVGLSDLVTDSLWEYEQMALRLAQMPRLLADIRQRLWRAREFASLFDSARFARESEAAYVRMWENWRRGEPPRTFAVADTDRCLPDRFSR